uniref:Uncharacterized protein n=1 Tax=Leersia perrieri TaxID=77586 RepID=A0A0D9WMR6_9ORYZ
MPLLTLRLVLATPPAVLIPSLPNYNHPPLRRRLRLLLLVLLAHRLLLRMRAASCAALLNGHAHVLDPRAVRKLLDEMPRQGSLLAPSRTNQWVPHLPPRQQNRSPKPLEESNCTGFTCLGAKMSGIVNEGYDLDSIYI